MKLDKEYAAKNRFWLLVAAAVPLGVVILVWLLFIVPRATAQKGAEIKQKWEAIKNTKDIKNETFVEKAAKKAKVRKKQEDDVWKAAWDMQRDLMTWPKGFEDKFHFADGNFALDIAVQPEDAKLAELPEDKDGSLFHGELKEIDRDRIVLAGRKKSMTFQRTNDVKIGGDELFQNLKVGKKLAVTYQVGKYFGEPLTPDAEQVEYARTYNDQIKGALLEAGPFNEFGEPVVQFKDWAWKKDDVWKEKDHPPKDAKFFRRVEVWNTDADISEDAWIAQENLWVQRELYRLVKKANDYLAQFTGESKSGEKTQVFTNYYWKMELTPGAGKKLHVKITNNLDRRQRLDARFQVQVQKDGKYVLMPRLDSEPLAPKGTKDDKGKGLDTFEQDVELPAAASGIIFGVRQVLTWETAAVRRIDLVSIGSADPSELSQSHRLMVKPLIPFKAKAADPKADDPDKKPPVRPVPGGDGAGGGQGPNKLIRDRYLEVTPQYRRLPVAVVLIVDPDHQGRVLTAFADSTLRLLMTQVIMNRYPSTVRPLDPVVATAPLPGQLPLPPKTGTGQDVFAERPGSGSSSAGGDDTESNVELVIYGVVSLYERHPPKANSQP